MSPIVDIKLQKQVEISKEMIEMINLEQTILNINEDQTRNDPLRSRNRRPNFGEDTTNDIDTV